MFELKSRNAKYSCLLGIMLCIPLVSVQAQAEDESEYLSQLDTTFEIGTKLYRHDQAAWHFTDALVQKYPQLIGSGSVDGWVTEETEDGIKVIFGRVPEEGPAVGVFEGLVNEAGELLGEIEKHDPPVKLREDLSGRLKARQNVIGSLGANGAKLCTERVNTAVLPASVLGTADEGWLVYLMPVQTKKGEISAGGFNRFLVSADGEIIKSHRVFMNTCLVLQKNDRIAATTLTHLLDPIPTEVHVFLMLQTRTPVVVLTTENEYIWSVESSGIQKFGDMNDN